MGRGRWNREIQARERRRTFLSPLSFLPRTPFPFLHARIPLIILTSERRIHTRKYLDRPHSQFSALQSDMSYITMNAKGSIQSTPTLSKPVSHLYGWQGTPGRALASAAAMATITAKKGKGLNKQSNFSAPTALFLVHLYAVIARLRRETSNKFPFLWRTTKDNDFLFFCKFSELGHGLVGELNKVE